MLNELQDQTRKPYFVADGCIMKETKDSVEQLTNFVACITKEKVYHDGDKATTLIELAGRVGDDDLPPVQISATDLASMSWVADRWGMRPIIFPVSNAAADIRTLIQLVSKPAKEDIYTHTGWTKINGVPTYLTTSGGISKDGFHPGIAVQLPNELQRYTLPPPNNSGEPWADSMRLINIGPKHVTWTLLLATYRACIRSADFAIHLAGRTGTFKSEISSLFQSHYGIEMDARHLPTSWSSTANALEALAYRAKDAICTVDDFVPVGTAWQVRTLQAKADQFIRGQGNQSGRSRLNDTSSMQTTYYPRGIILSTGEDIPEGHSVRGRMMIVEIAPGEIESAKLSEGQKRRNSYPQALSNWIQWLAKNPDAIVRQRQNAVEMRDRNLGIGHSRTPGIIGELLSTADLLLLYATEKKWITQAQADDLFDKASKAVADAGSRQMEYLNSADPVTAFCETIRQLLAANLAHLKTRNDGIPSSATKYGWIEQNSAGEMTTYKSSGPLLGWVDESENVLYLDPATMVLLKRHSGGKLAITPQTLTKRLREAGVICRTDATRERNTVRVTLGGHVRNVLALALDQVMDDENGTDF